MGVKISPKMKVTSRPAQKVISVGTIAEDNLTGYRFIYVQAGAAIAQYDAVRVNADLTDVRPTSATLQGILGVAQAAISNGAKGWVQIDGKMTCKVVNATAAGSPLASTATAGTLGLSAATDVGPKGIALVTGVAAGSAIYI
jgi:hypothetical protein